MPEPVFGKKIMVDYKAQRWKYEQRVIAKIEVGAKGTNIRFVDTKNKNNSPKTIYKRYCKRGCNGAIDDNGIVTMSIFDFLLNKRSTEFYF